MNGKNGIGLGISILVLLLFTAALWYYSLAVGIMAAVLSAGLTVFMALGMKKREEAFEQYIQQANFVADNATRRLLLDFFLPCILVGRSGSIIWFNSAVSDLLDNDQLIGNPISRYFPQLSQIDHTKENGITEITLEDKIYSVIYQRIDTKQEQEAYSFVLFDVTEQRHIQNRFEAEHVVIGIILVDNYAEVVSGIPDAERGKLVSDIDSKLYNWAALSDGMIYRLERERFLFVFNKEHLDCLVQNKFSILNDTKEIKNSKNIPVTLSIGVGYDEESIAKSAVSARAALELALGRGGDQTTVKQGASLEFFGGKTKTVQKTTKIKSRIISARLVSAMKASGNILVMAHQNPDFDAVAASVGIARLALFLGKRVNIITDLKNTSFISSKDMLRNIRDYDTVFVDSVYGQDLLTPDSLLVIVDASNPLVFESPDIYKNSLRTVIIDHHRQAMQFPVEPMITYVEPTASSASELVSEILEYALPSMTLYKEESELLMAGIFLDTQNFTRNVGIRTFSAAVYLRSEGGNPGKAQALFKSELSEFRKLAEFERNIMIFRTIFAISQYELDNDEENRVVAARAADRMLQIEGIRASFTLSSVGESIHVSARSDASVNVGLILEKLGGGGHYDSAGARLTGVTMKDALVMLRESIVNYCEKS